MGTAKVFCLTFAVPIFSHSSIILQKNAFSFSNSKNMIIFAALNNYLKLS